MASCATPSSTRRRRPLPTPARTAWRWRAKRRRFFRRKASPSTRSTRTRSASAWRYRLTTSSSNGLSRRRSSSRSSRPRPETSVTSAPANTGASAPVRFLLGITDTVAAVLLAADLAVVIVTVTLRSLFNAPVEWSDDVARGLMVGSSFFGAASAVARGENVGVAFFVDRVPPRTRRIVDAVAALLILIIAAYVAWHALELGGLTTGQTTGSGLPLEFT